MTPRCLASRVRKGAAAFALLALACHEPAADSDSATLKLGSVSLRAELQPEAPRVGSNRLALELRDANGAPLAGADVEVKVQMQAMGTMPAMGGPAGVEDMGDGRYEAEFELAMNGTWQVEVTANGERARGSLTVGAPGMRLAGGAARTATAAAAEHAGHGAPGTAKSGSAEVAIDPARAAAVGIRSVPAERMAIGAELRAAGRVLLDESRVRDVTLKVPGYVEELRVAAAGAAVARGDVLFTLYSPELHRAQGEYLEALASQRRARATGAPSRADALVRASRTRLALWDIAGADLDRLATSGAPLTRVPIRAPIAGVVIENNVVAGSAVAAGERLLRIAPLERVWVEAELYESELMLAKLGMPAVVSAAHLPGRRLEAEVAAILPSLSGATRTGRVRFALDNADGALRPDQWVDVRLTGETHDAIVVPQDAVLHAGTRSFVFIDLGGGRFAPRAVVAGMRAGDRVELTQGLAAGERVVASGTYLVASESRLRAALEAW